MSGKRAKYLPDSRKSDVKNLLEWISSSTDLVLYIYGPAGVGKSTLAGHLSDELRSIGWLGASVFMGAFPTDTSGPETIIKTLAYELGNIHPPAIPKIVEAMNRCHATSLENHFEGYIFEPVRSLNYPQSLIIIVDAIDEWRDHPTFIKALAHLNSKSAVVKFIITSRLNLHTSRLPGLDKISVHTYPLLPVSTDIMKAYFEKYLETIPWVDGRKPSDADVDKLADLSGGLPVWASTVISLLSQPFSEFPPHEILSGILASERQVGGSEGLAELYCNALLRLFPSSEARKHFRQYLGATLVLQEPLSLADFSKLVGMPLHLVKNIHSVLSAIQTRLPHGSENKVHPASTRFHLSFLEYVQATPASTAANTLTVSAFDSHSALGLTCLETVSSLPPFLARQASSRSYSPHDIQPYAIKYWPLHVSNGTHRSHDQWLQTPQCSALHAIPTNVQPQWATLFIDMLLPEVEEAVLLEEDMTSILMKTADSLRKDGGDHWVLQVACLEVAVRVRSDSDEAWFKLGQCYYNTGNRTGSPKMYEEAALAFRHALKLRPATHPDQPSLLNNIGNALWSLYTCNGDINVLNEGISHHRNALALLPPPHPDRSTSLSNLGGALQTLFERNGDINALNEGILHHRDALALLPEPHPDRGSSLSNLGGALQTLFECNGDIDALNEGIFHHRDALALLPELHPDRPKSLSNLGGALQILFERNRDISALKEGISHHRNALALRPASHPDRPRSLSNLGGALLTLYDHSDNINALSEGICYLRDALALWPAPHPDRPSSLNNLGSALRSLYECNGDIDALSEGILHLRDALALLSAAHPHRPLPLNNLAIALSYQHEHDGEIAVLDEAIRIRRELLVLRPPGHWYHAPNVQRLAALLETRFALTGDEADREESQASQRDLANVDPLGSAMKQEGKIVHGKRTRTRTDCSCNTLTSSDPSLVL
ncbi:hypothetical protein H1R20_g12718, partial [Candolleomyces eurysporus]